MACSDGEHVSRASAGTYGTLRPPASWLRKATKERTTVPWAEVSSLCSRSHSRRADRGKAQLGDKTVLDALEAARQATEAWTSRGARRRGRSCHRRCHRNRFVTFRSARRARIFGSQAIGRDDPGIGRI